MKIVLLNTYETGGAARACVRLFRGLLSSSSVEACMVVRDSTQSQNLISAGTYLNGFLRALLDAFPLHFYPRRQPHVFSPGLMPGRGVKASTRYSPDIVHLHWIAQGFVNVDSLRLLSCPIVWTLHDCWPFTGGCHLSGDCQRYEQSCGICPVLGSHKENDLSRRIWQHKNCSWQDIGLTIVSPSQWLADRARSSALFSRRRIEVIPNGIDTTRFTPGDQRAARRALRLPEDRKLLLFGANYALTDKNKGFDLLLQALSCMGSEQLMGTELVLFGENPDRALPDVCLPVRNLGVIDDEAQLVNLYRAADLFIAPSRQENLPNTVMESMACGTPGVAFAVGGIPELITHGKTGFLARPYEPDDLARGMAWLLADDAKRAAMSEQSRHWVENNISMERVVGQYLQLYRELAGK